MTAPPLSTGTFVQLNPSKDSPRAQAPSGPEQTIGVIRNVYNQEGQQYFQVVWNPGDQYPKLGNYTASQLTPLTQQEANQILTQLQQGTYKPKLPEQSSQYVAPPITTPALPPSLQPYGQQTL